MAFKLLLLMSLTIAVDSLQEPPRLINHSLAEFSNHSFSDFLESLDTSNETRQARLLSEDKPYPSQPLQTSVTRKLISLLQKERMYSTVKSLTWHHFRSRFYRYYGPFEAEGWLLEEINSTLANCDYCSILIVPMYFEEHRPDRQKSMIVKLEGEDSELRSELVILSAHYDTIFKDTEHWKQGYETRRAPGADCNGSGVAVLMELLRILTQSGIRLKTSVEFHFYTGKEDWLKGAQELASKYKKEKRKVRALLNLETIGYPPKKDEDGTAMALVDPKPFDSKNNQADPELNAFLKMLAEEYVDPKYGQVKEKICPGVWGVVCLSDHYVWKLAGFRVAMLTEFEPNPHFHSEGDTIEKLDFDQINEFAKLALAYVVELGVPANELDELPSFSGMPHPPELGWSLMGMSCLWIWMIN